MVEIKRSIFQHSEAIKDIKEKRLEHFICIDPCAGTGTFWLSFLNKQVNKYHDIEKAKENLIGIEKNEEMYVLSIANMLVKGDGKANLRLGSCFDPQKFPKIPNIGLMNPPYSQDKQIISGEAEVEFIAELLSFVKNGYVVVIVPVSTFTNKTNLNKTKREKIYQEHTLKAIINVPSNLFFPISVHTCVAIFQTERPHQKEHEENFAPLFSRQGKSFFEKNVSNFLLYKIKEKAGILDWELRINEAEKNGETSEKEKLKKEVSAEWIVIHNYLLYKWQEQESMVELKTTDKLSPNLQFLKNSLFADVGFAEKEVVDSSPELKLTDRERKDFHVEEVFDIEQGRQFRREDIQWGDYYYVTHSGKNNGIWYRASEYDYEGSIITVSASAGVNFFQDKSFLTCKEIHKLKLKEKFFHPLGLGTGLFLNTILSFKQKYYNRYDRRSQERLKEELIKLPVNKHGEPDWEFINMYAYNVSKRLVEKSKI